MARVANLPLIPRPRLPWLEVALGAAMLAGLGSGVIASTRQLLELELPQRVFKPGMPAAERRQLVGMWQELRFLGNP